MEEKDTILEDDFVPDNEVADYNYGVKQMHNQNDSAQSCDSNHLCTAANETRKDNDKNKQNKMISITRTEAILMFIFTILLIGVLCFMCTKEMNARIDRLGEEISNLEVQMAVISQQITQKEIEDAKEPIHITVNVDGKEFSQTVTPGEQENENTSPGTTKPFDESPFLGVSVQTDETGVVNPIGLPVIAIVENSPAHHAGIKAGDIIMSINGYEIKTLDHLSAVLDKCKAKDVVDVMVATTTENGIVCNTIAIQLTYKGNFDLD